MEYYGSKLIYRLTTKQRQKAKEERKLVTHNIHLLQFCSTNFA